jgi:putative hydrolase of the HAD superfamily
MIFFDIDGTLIDHASASSAASLVFFDRFADTIPFSREQFPVEWERILHKHFDRFCRGEISVWEQRRARMREVFAALSLSDDESDSRYRIFVGEYETLTQPYEDVAPCLQALSGKRMGIISNGTRDQQIGKLRRAGLLQHFSVMVFPEETGLGKPDSSIFLEACRRAGESPMECAHVGDNIESDVVASRALGMKGIYLSRSGDSSAAPPSIFTLRDLCSILQ